MTKAVPTGKESETERLLPHKNEQQSPAAADHIVHPRRHRFTMRTLLCWALIGVMAALSGFVAIGVIGYPLHASCRVEWTFGKPCDAVLGALRKQMDLWKTADNCGTGQKCLYTYLNSTESTLTGLHETPVKHYIDDISYTFTAGADTSCNVVGFSRSQLWYAILDYGTNYCNIKNLVDGANLAVNDSMFSEKTRDAVCTQYSSANCEVY